jgi:hypothetical protein
MEILTVVIQAMKSIVVGYNLLDECNSYAPYHVPGFVQMHVKKCINTINMQNTNIKRVKKLNSIKFNIVA